MRSSGPSLVWSTLEVEFHAYPSSSVQDMVDVVDVVDVWAERYWERPAWLRRIVDPVLAGPAGGGDLSVRVGGLPVWWARRVVAKCALQVAIDGWAASHRQTCTLRNL